MSDDEDSIDSRLGEPGGADVVEWSDEEEAGSDAGGGAEQEVDLDALAEADGEVAGGVSAGAGAGGVSAGAGAGGVREAASYDWDAGLLDSLVVNPARDFTPQAPAVNAMTGGRNRRKGRPPSRLPDLPEQGAVLHNSLCRIMGHSSDGDGDVREGARELQKLLTAGIRQRGEEPACLVATGGWMPQTCETV